MISESHLDFYRRWHRLAAPYFAWQFQRLKPFLGKRVADVGCGLGNFTSLLADRELCVGLDADLELLLELKKNHAGQDNIDIMHGDITNLNVGDELRQKKLDSIICVNVLEHLQDDGQAIQNMVLGLVDGGTLCLLVPAMSWLYGSLDTLDGHFRRYTKKSLLKKCSHYPLEVEEIYYFNFVGALGWLIKGRLLKQTRHTDENYRIMNFLIPLMSFVENYFPVPFGLSLVAVFRKI